jgi:hypothetical protein
VPADIAMYLHDGYSFEQATALAYAIKMGFSVGNDPLFRTKGPRVPGFAEGVENFGGGLALVGERGPELVNLPSGSDVLPFGRGSGGGVTLNTTIHITQPLGTPDQIATAVSDAVIARLRNQGQRF